MRRLAITPGGVAVSCSLILTLYPLDAAKLVQDVRHGGLGIERIVVTVDIGRTVEAGIGAIDIYGVVRCLEPLAVAVDNLLQALGVLLVVVGRPDVGLDMRTAADIVEGTGGVELLGKVVQVGNEAGELHAVGPPLFVHGCPDYDAGMVAVANNLLGPLGGEVTCHLGVVGIHTPRRSLAPSDVTQFVSPIVETLFEDLLVQAGTVEAGSHRKLDVATERLVGGSRPDTVGIETLVEYQTLVEGFVVEICLVAAAMELAHADIRGYLIHDVTLRIAHLVGEVVKEGTLGAPQLGCLDGQNECGGIGGNGALGSYHLGTVLEGYGYGAAVLSIEVGVYDDLLLVDIGNDLRILQSLGINGFHPNGLPDACGTGVHTFELTLTDVLLACGLLGGAGIGVGMNHKVVCLAVLQETGDIDGKACAAAKVTTGQTSVHIYLGVVIDSLEVEHDVTSCPSCRHLNLTVIPDVVDEVGIFYTRKLALGGKGNGNLSVEAFALVKPSFYSGADKIEGVAPLAVQVDPVLTLELGTWILWARLCPNCAYCCEKQ